ncbi:GGDEF domain-containing protein [Leptolinea sp. HRD-7]|nr:GGDEF domain-containing protein [Leptolinea sp. HRD-7]
MDTILTLDIKTIFFTQVTINLFLGLALWFSSLGRYQKGLNYFIGLFIAQSVTQFLYIFRGILPDLVTIVLANVLLIGSYNLGYLGYCQFFNRKVNKWFVILPIAIILVVFSVYIDNFTVRAITLGLVSAAQYLIQFVMVLSIKENAVRRSKPILLFGYGLIIVLFTARAVFILSNPGGIRSLLDPMWLNTLTLFASIPSILFIALGVLLLISDRLLEENRELATRDSLTHIFNRRTFSDLAVRELARAQRNNHETSLLMLDIDHFKVVNDTFGHPAGDQALIHLVKIMKETVRMQDLYGRWGGEEFVILLAETDSEEARQIAERLRQRIADSTLVINNQTIKMTVSIGIATVTGSNSPRLECMLEQADKAMYDAKHAGRNCVKIAPVN